MAEEFNAGTWYFSYLAEVGYIENSDSIERNYVEGIVKKSIFGVDVGFRIYCTMDEKEIITVYYAPNDSVTEYEEKEIDEPWWEQKFVSIRKVKVHMYHELLAY